MVSKKLADLSEKELIQLAEEYHKKMDDIMNEDDDEVECEKVFKKYIKEYEKRGLNVLKKRLEICKKLAETRPDYIGELETGYNELGDQYDGFGYTRKADEMYSLAEAIKREKSDK